jgi:hypothetical protein
MSRFEVDEGLLPPVCMQCGKVATIFKAKRFSWYPSWAIYLSVFVAATLTARMTVRVPLCQDHQNHWLWRALFIWIGLGIVVFLGFGALIFMATQEHQPGVGTPLGGLICFGSGFLALAWLIAAAIIQHTGIRPNEITDKGITLTNVSRGFIDALYEDRRREEVEDYREYKIERQPMPRPLPPPPRRWDDNERYWDRGPR